jgi:hypothetical protein
MWCRFLFVVSHRRRCGLALGDAERIELLPNECRERLSF